MRNDSPLTLSLAALALLLAGCAAADNKSAATTPQEQREIQSAQALRKSGDAPGALKILQAAQGADPDNPAILVPLGYALIESGHPQEAVNIFDRLSAVAPASAAAFNGKGVAFDHTGNHLAAQDLYKEALKLSPDSPDIRNNLAMSLILNGQADEAIPMLEALNGPGASKTIRQNLAMAYGLTGQNDKALTLNLQDLPRPEAEENMRFYAQYAQKLHSDHPAAAPEQIGFTETPAGDYDKKPVSDKMESVIRDTAPEAPAPTDENATGDMLPQ